METCVHIGIVTYNSREDIPACIQAVREQRYPDIRLTVVDNGSRDGTADWLQAHLSPDEVLVNVQNRGFAAGHNQIIDTIGDAHYLALNPDVVLKPDYVAALVETLLRRDAGWGVGKLIQTETQKLYSTGHALLRNGYAFHIGYGEADTGQYEEEREVFGASGAAVLYQNALIRSLGTPFFDDRLFTYHEDVDVDWRAQRHGWSCWYCPLAVARHRGGQVSSEMQANALANRYLVALKNACAGQLVSAIGPMLILHSAFRLLMTPRLGWRLITKVARYAPAMVRERHSIEGTCERMAQWFAWSRVQHSHQPRRIGERLHVFWKNYRPKGV